MGELRCDGERHLELCLVHLFRIIIVCLSRQSENSSEYEFLFILSHKIRPLGSGLSRELCIANKLEFLTYLCFASYLDTSRLTAIKALTIKEPFDQTLQLFDVVNSSLSLDLF